VDWAIVAVAATVATVVLLHAARGLNWFYDEWQWILDRRTGSIDDLLANHNGHLNLLPVLAYKAGWTLFGLTDYTPFLAAVVLLHVVTCLLLFTYLRPRTPAWFAVAATIVILFLGRAWQDLLWPFQIQYVGAVAGGLAALLLLDRSDRAGDIGASLCLAAAVACSGVGLPFALAIVLELVLRREAWRRLWVPCAPLVLYGVWYLAYGEAQAKSSNVHLVPSYTARAGAASIGALAGTDMDNGRYLVGGLVVLVIVIIHRRGRMSPRFAAVLALAVGYWTLTGLSRAQLQEPDASRYLYPGAIFVVLVLAELHGRTPLARTRPVIACLAIVLLATMGYSIHGNLHELNAGAAGLRDTSRVLEAELGALEAIRTHVRPDFRPDPRRAPVLVAGGYFRAVDDLGSPADSLGDLLHGPEGSRTAADTELTAALAIGLEPSVAHHQDTSELVVRAARGGSVVVDGPCVAFNPGATVGDVVLTGRALELFITASEGSDVAVSLRNIAHSFNAPPVGTVPARSTRSIALPRISIGRWKVRLSSSATVRVCATFAQMRDPSIRVAP
jgi:hypothetical protein